MPTGKRGLYISVNKEKKMSFLLKGERMSSQKKSSGKKKNECAGRKAGKKNWEMNRLYWHKGVIWGEIPSENCKMFVMKRIQEPNHHKMERNGKDLSQVSAAAVSWR